MAEAMTKPVAAPPERPAARPAVARSRRRWGRPIWRGILAALLLILFVFPFYWVVITSLNGPNQVLQFPPPFLPHWVFSNYGRAWSEAPWLRYFANTVFIALTTTFVVLLTSVLAGFAFGTMRFPGKNLIFAGFLSIMMVPSVVLLIPDYLVLKDIGWLNTYWAQIFPFGASVFGIFLLRQFFLSLPVDLWEAAQLDGASRSRYLWQIALPSARPALVTIALYIFLGAWNSFLWPYIMTSSPSVQPIEVGLATFLGTNGTDWTGLSAAVVFTTLPVMVLFLVAQRQFMAGASSATGGLKG
jgi:multiple sugar transport system permease protein